MVRGEALGEGETLGLTVGLAVGAVDDVGVTDGVGLGESEGDGVGDGVISGVADGVGETSGVGDGVTSGVAEGEALGSIVGEGVGEANAGSIVELLFCGSEVVLVTKSLALLSESSPFPAVSSLPPVPIEVASEDEFAFLSALLLAAGAVREVPSPSELAGDPRVTASTIIPSSNDPLTIATLLLFETVVLVLLLHPKVALSPVLHHR